MSDRRAFLVLLVLALVVVWAARSILTPFILSAGLAYAFVPLVSRGERRTGWPRPLIVGIGYLAVLAALALLIAFGSERLGAELKALSAAGPDLVAGALRQLLGSDTITIAGTAISVADLAAAIHAAIGNVAASPAGALQVASTAVDVLLQAVLVLIVTFYLIVDARRVRDWTVGLIPDADQPRTVAMLDHIQDVLSKWLRGEALLVVLVTVVVYLFLGPLLHVRYALAIAVLTGVLEVIPLVGPIIAAVIAMTAALVTGGAGLAVIVGIGFFVLRQLEDQVVMPVVIGRAVHLHPVVTIFAVLTGLSVYGVLGGLLGVPVAAAVNVVLTDLYRARGLAREPSKVKVS